METVTRCSFHRIAQMRLTPVVRETRSEGQEAWPSRSRLVPGEAMAMRKGEYDDIQGYGIEGPMAFEGRDDKA